MLRIMNSSAGKLRFCMTCRGFDRGPDDSYRVNSAALLHRKSLLAKLANIPINV